jgi:hypothetical protein
MKMDFLPRTVLALALCSLSTVVAAETATDNSEPSTEPQFTLKQLPSELRLSIEQVDMGVEGNNNLAGINFLFQPIPWTYVGVGGYAAVDGNLGGLFVLGADVGLKHSIYKQLGFSAGYFAGGGGAHHSDSSDHSGFMGRSHAGISYDFGGLALGIEYSHINFPDYNTSSNQFGLTLSTTGDFLYGNHRYQGHSTTKLSDILSPNYLGFYKTFISFIPQSYFLGDDDGTMQLVGIETGYFFKPNTYFAFSTSGAYDSNDDGYMDLFIGLGHELPLTKNLSGFFQGNIGAGGGGGTDTGGGFMYKPMLGLNYAFTPNFSIKLAGGYVSTTGDDFDGAVANLGLTYNFLNAVPGDLVPEDYGIDVYTFPGWRFSMGSETYINPQRENNVAEEDIGLVTVNIDHYLNHYLYVTGQAASAYHGNAGSYASGMIGLGAETKEFARTSLIADIMTGAAGGASMAVGRGAIYQPEVGFNVNLTENFGLQAKVGRVMAYDGDLDATTWNLGMTFHFTTVSEQK